jgi:hypothetical protein
MYRINRVYQNRSVVLIKLAGQLTDGDVGNWNQFVSDFGSGKQGDVILDFCDVAWISPKAARQLVDGLTKNLLLLNCPTAVKNMACSSGLEAQVLDKDRYDVAFTAQPSRDADRQSIHGRKGGRKKN